MAKSKLHISTTDKDKGWSKIVGQVGKCDKSFVQVGIQAGDIYQDGTSIADIAYYNEFGTDTIPSRPFMRQTFEKKNVELSKHVAAEYQAVLEGRKTIDFALNLLGAWYQTQIQNEIRDGDWTPNASVTIARKEAKRAPGNHDETKPLIDTGRMLASVRYVVKMGGK